ncbi:Y4yA family PLP-dependent enzyme [Fulvivirga sp. RKSG066]|nr:Y4yA family PLP-dependent enzyme [Fulvivirga aurantia]
MPLLPKLTPKKSTWMTELGKHELLEEVIEQFGSPVNIHHLPSFGSNIKSFENELEKRELKHKILFARKANKCQGFVVESHKLNQGVDTASYNELKECIALGVDPSQLVVTAAIKEERLLRLAIQNEILLILDNEDEFIQVQKIANELHTDARIGIRVSGFTHEDQKLYSRFGFDIEIVESFICNNLTSNKYSALSYEGLHFHLNGYSISQRGVALNACVALADRLKEKGYTTHFIDIGGGFLVNYLESQQEWEAFDEQLRKAVKGERDEITHGNNGLGYELLEGELIGRLNTYPYYNEVNKSNFMAQVLDYKAEGEKSNAQLLREKGIEIRMEPGRSLLDQIGMTVARVAFRKQDSKGDWLVGLEMNMTQMRSSSTDFLLDPDVIFKEKPATNDEVEVYFTGAYCLEQDILLKRKLSLSKLPDIGDFVMFINTAGYMMHFYESEAHLFDLATNVFYEKTGDRPALVDFARDAHVQQLV